MTMLAPKLAVPEPESAGPVIRMIHRASDGSLDLNWPLERLAEAIADEGATTWIDIERPEQNLAAIETMFRETFAFHPLAIEDALRETHVPKLDDWGKYLYLVLHAIDFDPVSDHLRLHELDVFLGTNYLVTCHSSPMPPVENVRRQIERDCLRFDHGPDHIVYRIMDCEADAYLHAIEHLDEAIDTAQEEVFDQPTPRTLEQIFRIKRSAVKLHRVLGPQREVANRLARDAYPQIDAPDRVYFRDIYDHLVRLHDISESLRDLISGALDTYLSVVSNRTNEIMKALTLVTVLFMPLTFLVGFFGMNFFGDNIHLPYAMSRGWMFWGNNAVMLITPFALWFWARRRGWFQFDGTSKS